MSYGHMGVLIVKPCCSSAEVSNIAIVEACAYAVHEARRAFRQALTGKLEDVAWHDCSERAFPWTAKPIVESGKYKSWDEPEWLTMPSDSVHTGSLP